MKYSDIKSEDDLRKYIQSQNKAAEPQIAANKKKSESQVATIKKSGTEGLKKQQEAQKAAKQAENNSAYSGLKTADDITNYLQKQNAAAKANASKTKDTGTKVQNTTPTKATNPHHGKNNTISHGRKAQYKEATQEGMKNASAKTTVGKAVSGMFDDEGYEEKFKRGEILGGTLSLAGEALQAPQSVLNNVITNAYSLAKGQGLAGWERKMDYDDFEKATSKIGGFTSISDKIGGTGGQVYKAAMDIATDPLNLADAGTGIVAKGLKNVKSATYADLLKANKLPEHTSRVLRGTAKVTDDEIEELAEELASQPQQATVSKIAEELATLPQQTQEEILKEFKEKGYVTDEQHALLAEYANQKRGKNVETPSVMGKPEDLSTSDSWLLENTSGYRDYNATKRGLDKPKKAKSLKDLESLLVGKKTVNIEDVKGGKMPQKLTGQMKKPYNIDDGRHKKMRSDEIAERQEELWGEQLPNIAKIKEDEELEARLIEERRLGKTQTSGNTNVELPRANAVTEETEIKLPRANTAAESAETKLAKAAEERELDEVQKTFESNKPKTENAEVKLPQASTTAKPEDVKVPVSKDTDLPRNTVTVTEAPKTAKTELSEADDALNAISKGEAVGKVKGIFRKLYKNLVSGTAEIERMAGRQEKAGAELTAKELTQALRTKTGTVNTILKNKLVDKAGNVISDKSYLDVMGQVPQQDLDLFNEYVQNLHNIDRWAQDKPLFEQISADESRQKVADILQQHPEFAQYQQDLKAWWDDFTQAWYVDTGIWSQETADYVRSIYPNYVPGFREGHNIKPGDTNSILTKIGALKRAKGGSSDVIPVQDSFLALINQAVSKSRKNELYANIIDTFERYGDDFKDFGVMTDAKNTVNPLDALDSVDEKNMEEVREGIYKLTAYVNGEEKSAYITKEMRDALALANDVYGGSEALKLVHDIASPLSNLRKSMITGLSPVFGTANLFRDVPTYYIQSQQSPLKATTSLFKAAKEIATKGDLYETYKALGGTQAGYYTQGKGFSDVVKSYKKSGLDKVKGATPFKAIEAYNETLETLPRLAEFIGMIEKYGDNYASRMRALDAAADVTTNFARSAPITKAADGWIMYLNASVQGLDKFARQVKNKPLATATKSAILLTMPYAMLYTVNKDNPHYQDLTDRVKQNYFVIPNMSGEKDEDGYAKTFFKIPLNREYGAIMASSLDLAFSYFEEGMDGLESASKSYKETLGTNFVPPGIEDNVLSFVGEIQNNEDYAGQKIVPTAYEDASPQYQTDINTSGIANTLAGLAQQSKILPDTMKSPMNVDYALSQMGYPGQLAQAVTSQQVGTAGERAYNTAVQPFVDRFTADPRQSSGVVSKFYDQLNKAETEVKDQELSGEVAKGYNSPTKEYKNSLSATSQEMSDLMKQEKEILANNALTKAEKKQKSNEIREQRNELARNATKTASSAQKAYEKVYVKELADLDDKWQQEYQAVKGQVSATKYKSGYTAQKGVKGGDVAKALKVYDATGEEALLTQYGITESGAQKAQSLINVQLAYEDYVKMKKNADSDGNGYIKTSEAKAYLNNSDYSNKQKAALYAALTSAKKNPYN